MTRLHRRRPAAATFAVPMLLGVLTLIGLIAGLTGAGRLSIVAWIGTGLPPLIALALLWRGRPGSRPGGRQQPSRSARSIRLVALQSQSCR